MAEKNRKVTTKLVDAQGLLEALFDARSRPSVRWVRLMQAQKRIPYRKIGRLVRFDIEEVRKAIEEKYSIHRRL